MPLARIITSETPVVKDDVREKIEGVLCSESAIIDGKGLSSLKENVQVFQTASGDLVFAATDIGVNYSKSENQDRVGVFPENNLVVVADGLGSFKGGSEAAELLVQAFGEFPEHPQIAATLASHLIWEKRIDGGTCFASLRVHNSKGNKKALISKAGDVKVMIVRNGKLLFASADDSLVQQLVDAEKLTADEALYYPHRNIVTRSIAATRNLIKELFPISVEKGDFILLLTDGITDNLTTDEITDLIRGKKPVDMFDIISDVTSRRMRDSSVIETETYLNGGRENLKSFTDGYKSEPKPDNRGMAVIQIG